MADLALSVGLGVNDDGYREVLAVPYLTEVKYAFIQVHQAEFPISLMCRVLKIARSGYYKWLSQPPSERERVNAALTETAPSM